MIFHPARLATEKAVFRPALPTCFLPGIAEMQMKLTYAEQLKHPNWQRRRLEKQEQAGWACECCSTADKTLHVHHKEYFKGRMAWEYSNEELKVLCEDCHGEQHDIQDRLKQVLAASTSPIDSHYLALGLVAGYLSAGYDIDNDLSKKSKASSPVYFYVGALAHMLALCPKAKILEMIGLIDADLEIDPVSAEIVEWLGRIDA